MLRRATIPWASDYNDFRGSEILIVPFCRVTIAIPSCLCRRIVYKTVIQLRINGVQYKSGRVREQRMDEHSHGGDPSYFAYVHWRCRHDDCYRAMQEYRNRAKNKVMVLPRAMSRRSRSPCWTRARAARHRGSDARARGGQYYTRGDAAGRDAAVQNLAERISNGLAAPRPAPEPVSQPPVAAPAMRPSGSGSTSRAWPRSAPATSRRRSAPT
jgi:hypothetical protein